MTSLTINTLTVKKDQMETIKERKAKSMGYRAARLHRLHMLVLDGLLAELGLPQVRSGTVPFLSAVLCHGGKTQDELAAWVSVSGACTARALSVLEEAGLVTRGENPDNRRQKLVYATDKARELETAFLNVLERNNDVMLGGFSDEERGRALRYMDRMIANLKAEAARRES